jgi:hypothetical protein
MWGIFSGRRERFRIVCATADRHAPDYGVSNELAEARRLLPAGRGDLTMKKLYLSVLLLLALTLIGWRTLNSPAAAAAEPAMKAHMNMLQLMRAFPFPHANVLFDTQSRDPIGPEKKQSMVFSVYRWGDSDTYAGWEGVENSALALAEIAPLLLTPRPCANGNPAPVTQPDWKNAVQGLVVAGEKAHKAALTRNMDAMLDVSETLSSACAACHEKYRDVDLEGGTRCKIGK